MARVLMMTNFSEAYANKLLQWIMRFSHEHTPWAVCKVPLSLRDGGAWCYVGLRHSFCHGWASGPTAWLSRHVLGIEPEKLPDGSIRSRVKLTKGISWR